jgi:outer membrane protein
MSELPTHGHRGAWRAAPLAAMAGFAPSGHRGAWRAAPLAATAGLGAFAVVAAGCHHDLFRPDEDVTLPRTSTRDIAPFDPPTEAEPDPRTVAEAEAAAKDRGLIVDAFPDRVPVSIVDVRASALANNLDLKVALFNPVIGISRLGAELAKFDSTIGVNYTRNTSGFITDIATVGASSAAQDVFNAALDVPLATGGQISLGPLVQYNSNESFAPGGAEGFDAGMEFSISQPLLRGAGISINTASIRIARMQSAIIDAQTKLQTIRLLADAERAYWNLYRAYGQLDVRAKQYESVMVQLEQTRRRVQQGDAAPIEITRAESGVGATVEQVIVADNQVRIRQRELKRIMNDPRFPIDSVTSLEPATKPNPLGFRFDSSELVAKSMENRMELLELEVQLLIDAERIDLARNDTLPNFVVSYQYDLQGNSYALGRAFGNMGDADGSILQVNASVPVTNERAKQAVSQAILARLQRLGTRESRKQAITQETLNALDTLETAWRRIIAARLETVFAGRTLQAEQRQFDIGLRTITEVLEAQFSLANAQSREIDALAAYQIALVDLAFATGTTLGAAGITLPEPMDPDSVRDLPGSG